MAASGIVQKLNAQVNREFYASHLYLRLSEWCTAHSLNGAATFLRNQAQHNVTQMMSLFEYMKQEGAAPVIGATPPPASDCASLEALFQQTLDDLQQRSASLASLRVQANQCHDDATRNLLDALAASHEEDRLLLQALLDDVKSASREGRCLTDIDRGFLNVVNYEQH